MSDNFEKIKRLMFPQEGNERIQKVISRLRNDKDKDHHCPGSLTWAGRCALDHVAADIIEGLLAKETRSKEKSLWREVRKGTQNVPVKMGFCIECGRQIVMYAATWDECAHYCPNCGAPKVGETRSAEDCRYFARGSSGQGYCLGTKEMDICEGDACKRWVSKDVDNNK